MTFGLVSRVVVLTLIAISGSVHAAATLSAECGPGKQCLINVPGTQCADGTPSYITLTKRAGAKNVLIYLNGGGACWDKNSCQRGFARPLTRQEVATEWEDGEGIHSRHDKGNPIDLEYDIVTVPYCTGDVYAGDRDANYGTQEEPYVIRHRGYRNIKLMLEAIKKMYPSPEKAVMIGCSAGGIGAYYHLPNFAATFPTAKKFVVSDAGTPFKPPYLSERKYQAIMKSWGAENTFPEAHPGEAKSRDFFAVIQQNTKYFPDIRFGLISSLADQTMTFFALAVGSTAPFQAVRNSIVDVAEHAIGRNAENAKVFFDNGNMHCHTPHELGVMTAGGTSLGQWMTEMISESRDWQNVRADLTPSLAAF